MKKLFIMYRTIEKVALKITSRIIIDSIWSDVIIYAGIPEVRKPQINGSKYIKNEPIILKEKIIENKIITNISDIIVDIGTKKLFSLNIYLDNIYSASWLIILFSEIKKAIPKINPDQNSE